MSVSFYDFSTETLDCLEDLIEQRLTNPDAALVPTTWHEAAAREEADRELTRALQQAGRAWTKAAAGNLAPPFPVSKRLH